MLKMFFFYSLNGVNGDSFNFDYILVNIFLYNSIHFPPRLLRLFPIVIKHVDKLSCKLNDVKCWLVMRLF